MNRTIILKWCIVLGCMPQAQAQRIYIETEYEQKAPVIFTHDNPGKHFHAKFINNAVIISDQNNKLDKLDIDSKTSKQYENIEVRPGTVSWLQGDLLYFLEDDRRNETGKVVSLDINSTTKREYSVKENPPFRLNASTWETPDFLWMFGGEYIHPETGEIIFLNDFWQLDKKGGQWKLLRSDQTPDPRSRAITWIHENTLYQYGGYDTSPLKDMWMFNVKEEQWQKMEVNEKEYLSPGLRFDAHSWADKGELWLWGGKNFTTDIEPFFWNFNLAKQRWTQVVSDKIINPNDCNSVFYEKNVLYFQMHESAQASKKNVITGKIIPLNEK